MNPCRCCNTDIVIIKGDTCQRNITVKGVDHNIIDTVYFTCSKLNISQELEYDSTIQKFIFYLSPETTATFKHITTDYDITIKFFDDSIKTVVYRGKMIVVDKNNPIGE